MQTNNCFKCGEEFSKVIPLPGSNIYETRLSIFDIDVCVNCHLEYEKMLEQEFQHPTTQDYEKIRKNVYQKFKKK